MLQPLSILFIVILTLLIGIQLTRAFVSPDKAKIWSPLTFIGATLVYYIIIPSLFSMKGYQISNIKGQWLFYLSAVLFYCFVLVGFHVQVKGRFPRWNKLITSNKVVSYGLFLFVIALLCYIPFRGFRTTLWDSDATLVTERTGFVSYFIDLISLLCASCGLLLMGAKKGVKILNLFLFLGVLYLTFVVYVVAGFRFRLVYLVLILFTIYHLYSRPKRVNFLLILGVGIPIFFLFAAMDTSRNYGRGLNRESLQEITIDEMEKGSRENAAVLYFSTLCTDYYNDTKEYVGFEPIINAVFMPFPRALFPWKPEGLYIREAQLKTLGSYDAGAAFLSFTEGFISFGWFGVVLYGFLIGLLSSLFWRNYDENRGSIGAILLLALFNGFCYQWVSRGYLGGNLNSFLYFVIVPFWLLSIAKFFKRKVQ